MRFHARSLEEEELGSKVQLGNTGKAVSFWPHLRENHYTDDGGDHHHIFGGAHMEDLFSSHMLEESRVAL